MEKIVFLGPDSPVKQRILEDLRQAGRSGGAGRDFVCAEPADTLTESDCALLFGNYDPDSRSSDLRWFEELAEAIGLIGKVRPRRALLVSDLMIYGKIYGQQRLVTEEEIGYLCHTAADEMAAQWMRTAEHLCARLAREEGLPVKIVRADWRRFLAASREEHPETILGPMLSILENGAAGEAYNLSSASLQTRTEQNSECERQRSPLSPVTVIPDTGKAEKYAAS